MYRGTHIDTMGRQRKDLGYFGLNVKTTAKIAGGSQMVVKARDKVAAANKMNKAFGINILPQNLKEISKTEGRNRLFALYYCGKISGKEVFA